MPFIEPPVVKVEWLMTKRKPAASAPSKAGNVNSADSPAPARPWTDEEMGAAKPLPLPTVDSPVAGRQSGVPHAGKGETKPGGRPEGQ